MLVAFLIPLHSTNDLYDYKVRFINAYPFDTEHIAHLIDECDKPKKKN